MSPASGDLDKLLGIMARLRDPKDGCAWDLEQTFATIAPYTIEEAYEVADAIQKGSRAELCEELGEPVERIYPYTRPAAAQVGRPVAVAAARRDAERLVVPRAAE